MFEKCHPVFPQLHFDTFCVAWEDYTGDLYFTNPYLVKIRDSRWSTKIVAFSNSRLPIVKFYPHYFRIHCCFLQTF
uniref:Protein REDUCED WALL ACETYLATION 4 n=1 Tax=Rhizophora mucronata TaxID=61149 RepID=A0A2P2M5B7_RHIMU